VAIILDTSWTNYATWLGILFCLTQSAMFSGLNLALFSISRLHLEIDAAAGNAAAAKVLKLRKDSNFVLATVLWGNVGINVLLTLLSNSVMVGLGAFLFSTFVITIGGEILPQAYFSRHALRMASLLSPLLRCYQVLLYVFTKPTALMLDLWLGKEGVKYMEEQDLRKLIHTSINAEETDVDALEGIGALNFLAIDDVPVSHEGEIVAKESIFSMPAMPGAELGAGLSKLLAATTHRWGILVDEHDEPVWAIDTDAYLRALFARGESAVNALDFGHHPIVVKNPQTRLGTVMAGLKADISAHSDAPVPRRVILVWGAEKRIITGADILGRLLKGIGLYSPVLSLPVLTSPAS
jgi:metal transporter CNNM